MPIRNTYRTGVLDDRPIAYWRLGETVGVSAVDETGHGVTGTYVGGVTLGQAGAIPGDGNPSVRLNGTTGHVTVPHSAAINPTTAFTIALVLRANTLPVGRHVLAAKGTTTPSWILSTVGASIRGELFLSDGSTVTLNGPTPGTAAFRFLALSIDALGARLVLDGVSVATASPLLPLRAGAATPLVLGSLNGASEFTDGWIDEVALYDRALRVDELLEQFQSIAVTHNQKALMFARAGLLRSGAGRSDYFNEILSVTIGGVSQAHRIVKGTTRIRKVMNDQPDSASFRTFLITPVAGQEVLIGSGAINNRQFGGVILRVKQPSAKAVGGTPTMLFHDVECADWTWILGKARVLKRYVSQPAHLIFLDLAATYAPGFTTSNVMTGSPTIDEITFDLQTALPGAFSQLANRAGWKWYPDAFKDLHFFSAETAQAPRPITPANLSYEGLDVEQFIGQIRTRVLVEGGGGQTTAPVPVSATSIPVDECSWYSASGGTLVTNPPQKLTYTGRTAASGPGSITGIPAVGIGSVIATIPQGQAINIFVERNDLAAQAALAALGIGDGVYEFFVRDQRLSIAGASERGDAELALFSATLSSGGYVTRDKFTNIGKTVDVVLPGRGVSLSVPIQEVEIYWVAHQRTERRARFDSAVTVDLTDVVRSISEGA